MDCSLLLQLPLARVHAASHHRLFGRWIVEWQDWWHELLWIGNGWEKQSEVKLERVDRQVPMMMFRTTLDQIQFYIHFCWERGQLLHLESVLHARDEIISRKIKIQNSESIPQFWRQRWHLLVALTNALVLTFFCLGIISRTCWKWQKMKVWRSRSRSVRHWSYNFQLPG